MMPSVLSEFTQFCNSNGYYASLSSVGPWIYSKCILTQALLSFDMESLTNANRETIIVLQVTGLFSYERFGAPSWRNTFRRVVTKTYQSRLFLLLLSPTQFLQAFNYTKPLSKYLFTSAWPESFKIQNFPSNKLLGFIIISKPTIRVCFLVSTY